MVKGDFDHRHIEVVQEDLARAWPVHYKLQTDIERHLGKKVNFKLDLLVVTILALESIVCARSYSRMMSVGYTPWRPVLRHLQNKHLICDSQHFRYGCESQSERHPELLVPVFCHIRPAWPMGVNHLLAIQLITWRGLCNTSTLMALRLPIGAAEVGFT